MKQRSHWHAMPKWEGILIGIAMLCNAMRPVSNYGVDELHDVKLNFAVSCTDGPDVFLQAKRLRVVVKLCKWQHEVTTILHAAAIGGHWSCYCCCSCRRRYLVFLWKTLCVCVHRFFKNFYSPTDSGCCQKLLISGTLHRDPHYVAMMGVFTIYKVIEIYL